ncbi:hypothetical protein EG329_007046 [Mollisiaceae sp. DMI_Dod_QoI]|nr:hypothetical protein EG329_007046 [Helotiales sp. DMI_Dod_QoI]
MSMRGSPINWWKEKRQSSHSGIPAATRPATAFPWTDNGNQDLKKIIQEAVSAAFESDAFKIAVASQVDPALSRHQEKLNQIKATNLNLESTFQNNIEDLFAAVKPIQDHLTALEIPAYGPEFQGLSAGLEKLEGQLVDLDVLNHDKELNDLLSGQSRLLKSFESRFDGLEARIEGLDRKIDGIDEAAMNSDLRSAIRFGELSNELQDRNTTLGDRIWEVQRDLGKKIDGQQRKVIGACEELGKAVRSAGETLEAIQAKIDEDDTLTVVNRAISRAESFEKSLRHHVIAIQEKVSNLDTSAIPLQAARMEIIERGMSEVKKELEVQGRLASLDSKMLSANTSKLGDIVSTVGKIQTLAESTNEISKESSESQELNAASLKDGIEVILRNVTALDSLAVSHAEKLGVAVSNMTRMESALVGLDTAVVSKFEGLKSSLERIEDGLTPLSAHTVKLDELETILRQVDGDLKPQRTLLDELMSTLSEMRSNINEVLSSHDESLETIRQKVLDTSSLDQLTSSLSEVQSGIDRTLSPCLTTIRNDTSNIFEALENAKTVAARNHDHVAEYLRSITHANTSTKEGITDLQRTILTVDAETGKKEDITALQTVVVQSLRENCSVLEEVREFTPVVELSATVNELVTSILSGISNLNNDLRSTSRSTIEGIGDQIKGLNGELQKGIKSVTEDAESRARRLHAPIAELLEEVRTSKLSLEIEKAEIREELRSTKTSVEVSQAAYTKDATAIMDMLRDAQETRKDDEILIQIESWAQKCISKQTSDVSTVTDLLQAARDRQETLQRSVADLGERCFSISDFLHSGDVQSSSILREVDTIRCILENDEKLSSVKQMATDSERVLNAVQLDIQQIRDDPTARTMKQLLLQNASSMATAYEGILAIDTKIKTSEDFIYSAVQDMQTALGRDILDAALSITASMDDNVSDLKADLGSRISTSTNVLRGEVKGIDLIPLTSTLESLREDVQSYSKTMHDNRQLTVEDIITHFRPSIDSLAKVVGDLGDDQRKTSQQNVATLSHLTEVSATNSASLSGDLAKIQQALDPISDTREEVKMIVGAIQTLEHTAKSQTGNLSAIHEIVLRTNDQLSSVPNEFKTAIDTCRIEMLQAVETNYSILSKVEQANSSELPGVRADIKDVSSALAKAVAESEATQASILSGVASSSTEILAVKSQIGGMSASLTQADEERREAEKIQASVLSTVRRNSAELSRIEETLRHARDEEKESLDAMKLDISTVGRSVLQDTADLKATILRDLGAVKSEIASNVDEIGTKVEGVAAEIVSAKEATLAALNSERKALSDTVILGGKDTSKAIDTIMGSILSEIHGSKIALGSDLSSIQTSLQSSIGCVSDDIGKGFADAATERRDSRKASEANFASLSNTILHETEITHIAVEAMKSRVLSEMQKTDLAIRSNLDGIESDIRSVSSDVNTGHAGIRKDIKLLDGQTLGQVAGLETSISQTNITLSRSITETEVLLQSSLNSISNSMKAVDAAVRVNSAAISRVDKAVLETASQVKGEVRDGNREMLFQLEEELHETGGRLRSISEFDIPRLEATGKRNRDALEVIGARVVGTAKKFDEMITHHSQRKPLDSSDLFSGRLRGGSNASSRDAGGLRMSAS